MTQFSQFTYFRDFKRSLLGDRLLPAPDGRPLYRYRLSESEFDDLEALLQDKVSRISHRFPLNELGTRFPGFPALFVLYAAEWWRRRFDGSHWSWDPILKVIGANPDECGIMEQPPQPRKSGAVG